MSSLVPSSVNRNHRLLGPNDDMVTAPIRPLDSSRPVSFFGLGKQLGVDFNAMLEREGQIACRTGAFLRDTLLEADAPIDADGEVARDSKVRREASRVLRPRLSEPRPTALTRIIHVGNRSRITSCFLAPSPCPLPRGERGRGEVIFERFLTRSQRFR